MHTLLKLPEVLAITKKSRSSTLTAVRNGTFPAPISIGAKAKAWIAEEVQEWINQQAQARFPKQGGANE